MTPLDYVIQRACERYGHNGREFTTANFQSELSRITSSTPMITPQAAELLLMSATNVKRNSPCHWRTTWDTP